MAKIGLRYPVAAVIESEPTGAKPVYGAGFVIGKAITANKNVESTDNPLYADDAIAEQDSSFSSGTIELGVADFGSSIQESLEIQAKMLGHEVVTEDEHKILRKKRGDNAPVLGLGFIKTKKMSNVQMFEATWLYKVKFQLPSESTVTKGENVEWQTPTITGRIMFVESYDNLWEDTALFETFEDAKSWLNSLANISEA